MGGMWQERKIMGTKINIMTDLEKTKIFLNDLGIKYGEEYTSNLIFLDINTEDSSVTFSFSKDGEFRSIGVE